MSHLRLTAGTVFAFALAASLAAQTPPQNPPTPAQPQSSMDQKAAVTLEGCLVNEKDVPGRQPNPAEKAGVMEDFILTTAKYVKAPAGAATDPAAPTGTSGIGALPMFEVRGLDKAKLTEHVGKRVQIDGTINPKDLKEAEAAKAKGEPTNDLPEVQATAIKSVPGDCKPAK